MAVGLYLHYPNFIQDERQTSSVKDAVSSSVADLFFPALQTETRLACEITRSHDNRVSAIYIGGAAVSLEHLDQLSFWLGRTSELFVLDDPLEFSMAVAPEHSSRQLLEKLQAVGVTRIDFAIGSFDRRLLRLLGRRQKTHQVHEAIYLANALGFGSFGCDFVFGLPGQTGKKLSDDLDQLTDLEPPQVTLRRWKVATTSDRDLSIELPGSEFVDTLQQAAVEHLAESGYEEYAAGLFARSGHQCRYHADRAAGGDYIGLGPSAKSLLNGQRSRNVSDLTEYIDRLAKNSRPLIEDQ